MEPHHDRPEGKKSLYSSTREGSPPGGQTRSSLAGGSQPIALPCRSKAAATDQEAGPYRPRAPPQERRHPMLSRRLLLGLPSRLPKNRCILVQVPARPEAKSLSPVQCCCQLSHGVAAGTVIGNSALMGTYVSNKYRLFQRFSHCIPVLFPGFQRHNAQISCQGLL